MLIDEGAQSFIENFLKNNKEKIKKLYDKDVDLLKQELLETYETYLLQESEKRENKNFRKELSANISLEDQNSFAREHVKKQEERQQEEETSKLEDLPIDAIL